MQTIELDDRAYITIDKSNPAAQEAFAAVITLNQEIQRADENHQKDFREAIENFDPGIVDGETINLETCVAEIQEGFQATWQKKMADFQVQGNALLESLRIALNTSEPIADKRLYMLDGSYYQMTGIAFVVPNTNTTKEDVANIRKQLAETASSSIIQ